MKPRIATRNGRPAYENAPPRLRASQIERPRGMDERPWWRFGNKKGTSK